MSDFSGDNLSCVRSGKVVFTGLSFRLSAGGALILRGANGSGKSSLLRMMAGLLPAYLGRLAWDDSPVSEDRDAHCARLHYVGHNDALKPVLSVQENLAFWAGLRRPRSDVDAAVKTALAVFDIGHLAELPGQFLSAGQRRRVNLARIVAAPAPLWLLDEPATALDRAGVTALEAAIRLHRKNGGRVVLSTHGDLAVPRAKTLNLETFAPTESALEAAS